MTGKELIIYILQNGLENEPVFKDGKFVGFQTIPEAAVRFDVGPATISSWIDEHMLDYIYVPNHIYIPATAIRLPGRNLKCI